jgi:hypothetical protein
MPLETQSVEDQREISVTRKTEPNSDATVGRPSSTLSGNSLAISLLSLLAHLHHKCEIHLFLPPPYPVQYLHINQLIRS